MEGLQQLPVKALKHFLVARGVDISAVSEKSELLTLLERSILTSTAAMKIQVWAAGLMGVVVRAATCAVKGETSLCVTVSRPLTNTLAT